MVTATKEEWTRVMDATRELHISLYVLKRIIRDNQLKTKPNNRDKRSYLVDVAAIKRVIEE
jgi:hypothetical protein